MAAAAAPQPVQEQWIAPQYIVYFGWDTSDIDSEAAPALDAVAALLNRNQDVLVTLSGHTDRGGEAGYNIGLS